MNRLSALLVVSLALLQSGSSVAAAAADECCLCNDCDMMMNADATVYDLDEGRLMACSDFAELVFHQVSATSETCHMIQGFYQTSCCMNANLQQEEAPVNEEAAVDHRRSLEHSIPLSRRELWVATTGARSYGYTPQPAARGYASFGSTQSFAQPSFSYAPPNTNGNALGCTVPPTNNGKVVQLYRSTSTGFAAPTGINCGTASTSGIGMSASDSMYAVSLKCVRCNCCGSCTGIDANVCVGNNQPRASPQNAVGSWTATRGTGWRNRFLEFLDM
jgi:hypothetical protein